MSLAARVRVARRFQRAIRVDLDTGDPAALTGFVCPQSSAAVLQTMARHIAESGQAAFTWTGPYGSGKSSLAVAFSAALNGQPQLRNAAVTALGPETAEIVWKALPPQRQGVAHPAGHREPQPAGADRRQGAPSGAAGTNRAG